MPTTYELAGDNVDARMRRMLIKYHGNVAALNPKIGCLFARNEDGPAVTAHGGYPALAKIRIVALKDRAAAMPDAQIIIDESRWNDLDEAEKDALLDHELTHLEPSLDKLNFPKRDDLDRPKFKMRKHDAQLGIFKDVIERHGEKALDAQIAKDFIDEYGQLLMWSKDKKKVG